MPTDRAGQLCWPDSGIQHVPVEVRVKERFMEVGRAGAVERALGILRDFYGEDLHDDELGQIMVRDELITEYSIAWAIPFASEHFVKSGDVNYALIPSVLLVPKDGSPTHYPPSAIPVEEYVANVASGLTRWPS